MHTADVVIIGGGIVGSSIAYHLTAAGCTRVLIVERETYQGKGSTGKSMGGVRAQFATTVNIQMSLYSIPFYASFEQRLGHPSGYRAQGYLFLAMSEAHLNYLRANQERQKALGLRDVHMVPADDIRKLFPLLRSDDILGGSFCATDGFVDPYSAMVGFTAWACEHGAQVWRDTEVTGIKQDARGVCSVETRGVSESRASRRNPERQRGMRSRHLACPKRFEVEPFSGREGSESHEKALQPSSRSMEASASSRRFVNSEYIVMMAVA